MGQKNVTRGWGLLERFLAEQRFKMADRLIPGNRRNGKILDIGCGSYPFALIKINFSEKYGVDKVIEDEDAKKFMEKGINLIKHDLERDPKLPFDDEYFDAVIMLAVLEHIAPNGIKTVLKEIHRVLKPGGTFVLTTPTPWSNTILKLMSALRLVSPYEIDEHKHLYSTSEIYSLLTDAGFRRDKIKTDYFEIFMNTWVKAEK